MKDAGECRSDTAHSDDTDRHPLYFWKEFSIAPLEVSDPPVVVRDAMDEVQQEGDGVLGYTLGIGSRGRGDVDSESRCGVRIDLVVPDPRSRNETEVGMVL